MVSTSTFLYYEYSYNAGKRIRLCITSNNAAPKLDIYQAARFWFFVAERKAGGTEFDASRSRGETKACSVNNKYCSEARISFSLYSP